MTKDQESATIADLIELGADSPQYAIKKQEEEMTKVKCSVNNCLNNKRGNCQLKKIHISSGAGQGVGCDEYLTEWMKEVGLTNTD